jgi:hypothetical protein
MSLSKEEIRSEDSQPWAEILACFHTFSPAHFSYLNLVTYNYLYKLGVW